MASQDRLSVDSEEGRLLRFYESLFGLKFHTLFDQQNFIKINFSDLFFVERCLLEQLYLSISPESILTSVKGKPTVILGLV